MATDARTELGRGAFLSKGTKLTLPGRAAVHMERTSV